MRADEVGVPATLHCRCPKEALLFDRILIALHPDDSIEALVSAMDGLKTGASLSILAVVPKIPVSGANAAVVRAAEKADEAALEQAKELAEKLSEKLGGDVPVRVRTGHLAEEVQKEVEASSFDLVVKAAERQVGEKAGPFRNTERKIIRRSPVPVMIVREGMKDGAVAVAVDHPPEGAHAVEGELMNASLLNRAAEVARRLGVSRVLIVHAWQSVEAAVFTNPRVGLSPPEVKRHIDAWEQDRRTWLGDVERDAQARFGADDVTFEGLLVEGAAERALPEAISRMKVGTLIIGTANRQGLAGLFIGNTAEALLDRVEASMVVVKPEGVQEFLRTFSAPKSMAEGRPA